MIHFKQHLTTHIIKKDLILTALISGIMASTLSVIAVFAFSTENSFPDVDSDAYYASSVYKMAGMGVVTGYDNGDFGPDDYVTRGQIVTMLDRYDESLLTDPDNTVATVSGIQELVTLLCSGAVDFSSTSEHTQETYEEICLTDGNF